MIDREKIVEDLEFCVNGHYKVELSLAKKILALLKEEPVKPVVNQDEWVCGCCRTLLERQRMIYPGAILHDLCEYCPACGKKVDWEAVKQDG